MRLWFLFSNACVQGSRDNMSIIIVAFPGCPQPTPEAIAADERLNAKLQEIVTGWHWYRACVSVVAARRRRSHRRSRRRHKRAVRMGVVDVENEDGDCGDHDLWDQ